MIDPSEEAVERSTLWKSLQALGSYRGVSDNRLGRSLTPELREYWGIGLGETDQMILEAKVKEQLERYIPALKSRAVPLVSTEILHRLMEVTFGIYDFDDLANEDRETREKRWEWFNKKYRVSPSSSKRAFWDALNQLEELIRAGQHDHSDGVIDTESTEVEVSPLASSTDNDAADCCCSEQEGLRMRALRIAVSLTAKLVAISSSEYILSRYRCAISFSWISESTRTDRSFTPDRLRWARTVCS